MSVRVEHGDMREVLARGEGMVDATCQHCRQIFQVIPSRAKHGRGKSCSPACQYAAIKARGPRFGVALVCIGCAASFTRTRTHAVGNKGKYCTRACRDRHRIREKHPQFIGRPGHHRGPNWHAQKRKSRRRDNWTCQHCQGPGHDVHHIRPFRLFADYLEANDLGNLITLCRPCHRVADAQFQAVEAGRGR